MLVLLSFTLSSCIFNISQATEISPGAPGGQSGPAPQYLQIHFQKKECPYEPYKGNAILHFTTDSVAQNIIMNYKYFSLQKSYKTVYCLLANLFLFSLCFHLASRLDKGSSREN